MVDTVQVIESSTSLPLASAELPDEHALTTNITRLWSAQSATKNYVKRTRTELQAIRNELGQQLHTMKQLYVGTGRDGQWARFLREQGIPVSTANRYVAKHEAALQPEKKLLSKQLPEGNALERLVTSWTPKLKKVITTAADFQGLARLLAASLEQAKTVEMDNGLLICSA